jgi:arylsulfatase A-like enzyme
MIVRWPGRIEAGTVCQEIVSTMDLYPTFLQAAGLPTPASVQLDGNSLLPLLTQTGNWQPVTQFWHFPIYLQAYQGEKDDARDPLFRTRPGSAMREGNWKLHEYFEDGAIELYDLDQDPGERVNLAESMPGKAKELHDQMLAWRERVGAPVPTETNPKYDAAVEQKWLQKVDDKK